MEKVKEALEVCLLAIAGACGLGVLFVGTWILFVALTDASIHPTSAAFLISAAFALIALLHYSVAQSAGQEKPSSLWSFSFETFLTTALVVLVACAGLMGASYIVVLLIALSEHKVLPEQVTKVILSAREDANLAPLTSATWIVLQLLWIIPAAFRVHRLGLRGFSGCRRIAARGGITSIALAGASLAIVIALGIPASRNEHHQPLEQRSNFLSSFSTSSRVAIFAHGCGRISCL